MAGRLAGRSHSQGKRQKPFNIQKKLALASITNSCGVLGEPADTK